MKEKAKAENHELNSKQQQENLKYANAMLENISM